MLNLKSNIHVYSVPYWKSPFFVSLAKILFKLPIFLSNLVRINSIPLLSGGMFIQLDWRISQILSLEK